MIALRHRSLEDYFELALAWQTKRLKKDFSGYRPMEQIGDVIRRMRRKAGLLPFSDIALFTWRMKSLRRKRKERVQR
jgi:hypothetical protein